MISGGRFNFGFNHEIPQLFVTSQWQQEQRPSIRYLIYRWIVATYFLFVVALSLITAGVCEQLRFYAIYLTNWNVLMNGASSLLGAVIVTLYYRGKIKFDDSINTPTVLKLYWLLVTLSTVISISLSCIYWPFIHNGRDSGVNDALTHAGNAIVMLIDIFIHAHPPRFGHFVYPLAFGFFYGVIFVIPYIYLGGTNRDYSNYIYSVLDWQGDPKGALIFTLATFAFLIIMHFVLTSLGVSRLYLHKSIKLIKTKERSTEGDNHGFNDS